MYIKIIRSIDFCMACKIQHLQMERIGGSDFCFFKFVNKCLLLYFARNDRISKSDNYLVPNRVFRIQISFFYFEVSLLTAIKQATLSAASVGLTNLPMNCSVPINVFLGAWIAAILKSGKSKPSPSIFTQIIPSNS